MSNVYYNQAFTGNPGQTARTAQVVSELNAVEVGFDAVQVKTDAYDAALDATTGTTIVRTIRAPAGETLTALVAAASRANKFIQFDATGLIPQMVSGSPSVPTPGGNDTEFQWSDAGVLAGTGPYAVGGATAGLTYIKAAAQAKIGTEGLRFTDIVFGATPTTTVNGLLWLATVLQIRLQGVNWDLLGMPRRIKTRAGTTTITADYAGTIQTNDGAGADIELTLPNDGILGVKQQFAVVAAHYLKIKAPGTDVIYNAGSVSGAAGYIRSTTVGHTVTVELVKAGKWMVTALTGTWTVDS